MMVVEIERLEEAARTAMGDHSLLDAPAPERAALKAFVSWIEARVAALARPGRPVSETSAAGLRG